MAIHASGRSVVFIERLRVSPKVIRLLPSLDALRFTGPHWNLPRGHSSPPALSRVASMQQACPLTVWDMPCGPLAGSPSSSVGGTPWVLPSSRGLSLLGFGTPFLGTVVHPRTACRGLSPVPSRRVFTTPRRLFTPRWNSRTFPGLLLLPPSRVRILAICGFPPWVALIVKVKRVPFGSTVRTRVPFGRYPHPIPTIRT